MTTTLLICLFFLVDPLLGCGTLPGGQARTLSFTVSGFNLPISMTWTSDQGLASQIPGILRSGADVQAFVQRLIMQAVFDVLEQQGRSAGLFDAVIAGILSQLTVSVGYQPLHCEVVAVLPNANIAYDKAKMMGESCVVSGNTVSGLCRDMSRAKMCMLMGNMPSRMLYPYQNSMCELMGTISTTNIIMANWSTQMWQSVLNRVTRALASGPFGTNFAGVSAIISGS
ncbi:hypothetical protein KIN20_027724 [Parelaphostrongylus tenuis]|uniref:Secreted protein n=1 Tax=Parelaphostrongylus tenuis TaxID=148309 RepID=A0AAD5QZR2_PARTN|nr:hypothetical protein KIN20_027724 [Parelaphostrongylus tenuis]